MGGNRGCGGGDEICHTRRIFIEKNRNFVIRALTLLVSERNRSYKKEKDFLTRVEAFAVEAGQESSAPLGFVVFARSQPEMLYRRDGPIQRPHRNLVSAFRHVPTSYVPANHGGKSVGELGVQQRMAWVRRFITERKDTRCNFWS